MTSNSILIFSEVCPQVLKLILRIHSSTSTTQVSFFLISHAETVTRDLRIVFHYKNDENVSLKSILDVVRHSFFHFLQQHVIMESRDLRIVIKRRRCL